MKVICPTKSIFNIELLHKFKKYFYCNFKNLNQNKFSKIVHKYEVVIVRFNRFISYKKNHKIRFILSPTTGQNHIDKRYFKDKKVKFLLLKIKKLFKKSKCFLRIYTFTNFNVIKKNEITDKKIRSSYLIGNEVAKKKIGIIGLGRNGLKISKILKKLNAEVFYFDKNKKSNKFAKFLNLDNLLKLCEIIVICIPLNLNNKKFLDKSKLNKINNGSLVVNTSRGDVLDEDYIINLAKKNKLFYTADVMTSEFSKNHLKNLSRLNKFNNIFITNHIGGLTKESIYKTDKLIFDSFLEKLMYKR